MKKILGVLLVLSVLFTGCAQNDILKNTTEQEISEVGDEKMDQENKDCCLNWDEWVFDDKNQVYTYECKDYKVSVNSSECIEEIIFYNEVVVDAKVQFYYADEINVLGYVCDEKGEFDLSKPITFDNKEVIGKEIYYYIDGRYVGKKIYNT